MDVVHPHRYDKHQGETKAGRHRGVQLQVQHRSEIDSRVERRSSHHGHSMGLRGEKHEAKNDHGT